MDLIRKNKKFISKALLIVFVLVPVLYFGVNIQHANAQFLNIAGFAIKSVLNLVTFLLGIVQWIVGVVLIKLGAILVGFVLLINQTLLKDLNNDHFVVIGWRVFRDLANLGFVLGIIIIAISTILRFKTYAYQNLLPKLIIAALVINFSLVIAGSIISVSDIFSNFFISYISGRGSDSSAISTVSQQIVDRFNYVKLAVPGSGSSGQCSVYKEGWSAQRIEEVCQDEASWEAAGQDFSSPENCRANLPALMCAQRAGADTQDVPDKEFYAQIQKDNLSNNLYQIGGVFISVVVGFFIFLSLLALAGGLFLRYFYLAFLLIVSPLVWVLWVFPYTRGHWKKWWESFIKWTFFAPVVLFFLYLTLIFLSKSSGGYGSKADEIALTSGTSIAGVGFSNIIVPLMAGALLFAGLKISQTMGFAGASFVLNRAEKMGGWARTKAVRGAQRGGALARVGSGNG